MHTHRNRAARWIVGGAAALAATGALGSVGSVAAAPGDIVIVLDRVVRGAPGEVITLESTPVDPAFAGRSCAGTYTGGNNTSVHPGTTVIMSSDGSSVTIPGVEDAPGQTITASGPLTMGDTVDIAVQLGPDGVASIRASLTLDCAEAALPTTTVPEVTTTTAVAAAAPTTTAVLSAGAQVQPRADAVPATGAGATAVMLVLGAGTVAAGLGVRRLAGRDSER